MKQTFDQVTQIKREPKAAFFIGGERDGGLVGMNEHPAYLDFELRVPSPIVVPGKKVPALTKERYFLHPKQVVIKGNPVAIYIIQGWDDESVLEYLMTVMIQVVAEDN